MKFWFSKSETAAPKEKPSQEPANPQPAAERPETPPSPAPEPPSPQPAAPQPAAPEPQAEPEPPPPISIVHPPAAEQQQPAEEPPAPAPAEAKGPTQRELYRSLMDALYDAVLLVDDKGHVVDSSIRVEHVFGYTPGDMWDMSLSQLIRGFTPVIFTQLAQPLSENRPVIMSGRGVRKDGSLFDAEVSVSKVKLLRNDTMLFAVRDVTRRNESIKEKLMAQLQAKPAAAAAPASPPTKVLRCIKKVTPAK
jgi:PAS domain S-box-containing protein